MELRQLPWRAIILGFGVGVAVVGAIVIGILYHLIVISIAVARLWLLALGVVVNGLLVSAYVLTLLDTQRRIKRAEKRPHYSDILDEILDPAIQTLRDNRRYVKLGIVNWFDIPRANSRVSTVAPDRASLAAKDHFESEFSEVSDSLDDHDKIVQDINKIATKLQNPLESEIEEYVHSTEGLPMGEVKVKVFAYSILNCSEPQAVEGEYREEWRTHREDLLSIRDNEEIRERIERFDSLRDEYLDQLNELLDELVEQKQELRAEIQIP